MEIKIGKDNRKLFRKRQREEEASFTSLVLNMVLIDVSTFVHLRWETNSCWTTFRKEDHFFFNEVLLKSDYRQPNVLKSHKQISGENRKRINAMYEHTCSNVSLKSLIFLWVYHFRSLIQSCTGHTILRLSLPISTLTPHN